MATVFRSPWRVILIGAFCMGQRMFTGGVINVLVALFALIAFLVGENVTMAVIAGVAAIVCAASGLHMHYFARALARQRLFVEALQRGDFETGSTEAKRYWKEMPITVDLRDVLDGPNWITAVNMVATLVAFILAIWGGIGLLR